MVGGRIETMVKAMTQAQSIDAFKKLTKSFKNQFKATYVSGALNQCAYNMNLKICILGYIFCESILLLGSVYCNAKISQYTVGDGFKTYGSDYIEWFG